VSIYIDLR